MNVTVNRSRIVHAANAHKETRCGSEHATGLRSYTRATEGPVTCLKCLKLAEAPAPVAEAVAEVVEAVATEAPVRTHPVLTRDARIAPATFRGRPVVSALWG